MKQDLALVVAHSHPDGPLAFSGRDDIADAESFGIVYTRMDTVRPHFSLVMDGNGEMIVRAFGPELKPSPVTLIRIIGKRYVIRYPDRGAGVTAKEFDRSVRAFGRFSVQDLAAMRVGIVGCGGTGSAIVVLLARLGVGCIVLIDPDRVELTNLNRLHFSKRRDAILGRLKVDVVAEAIADIGLATSVVGLPHFADSPQCRDALRSCDVVFGCTDDHLGRDMLNRLAHFYLIPVIDVGLLIKPNEKGSGYEVFDGRVTVLQPGYPCQVCRKLINPDRMLEEDLRRGDPVLFEERRRAGYVSDAPDPSPVVVTFTTEIATMAVNELMHRLTGFRGPKGEAAERVRRFTDVKDCDTLPGAHPVEGCLLCQQRRFDGRGDMKPYLNRI
jgi:molybdopterin/thiamine biosynthesis adenylyltransferase